MHIIGTTIGSLKDNKAGTRVREKECMSCGDKFWPRYNGKKLCINCTCVKQNQRSKDYRKRKEVSNGQP